MIRNKVHRTSRISKYVAYKETLVNYKEKFWSFLGSFLGLAIIAFIQSFYFNEHENFFLIGSFGASSVLIYGVIQSPLAQPRNLIGGHILSASIGVTIAQILPDILWLTAPLAVSLSITALLITHGLSGSGKTRGSQALLERLGAIRLRSDIVRKQLHGVAPLQHGKHAPGRGLYAQDAPCATYARLGELAGAILRAGYTVIVDAAFLQRWQRAAFRALADECAVALAIVHFTAPVEHLRRRVARRHAAGSDASDADLAVLDHQLATHEPLQAGEADFVLVRDPGASSGANRADARWQPLLDFLAAASAGGSPPPPDLPPSAAPRP